MSQFSFSVLPKWYKVIAKFSSFSHIATSQFVVFMSPKVQAFYEVSAHRALGTFKGKSCLPHPPSQDLPPPPGNYQDQGKRQACVTELVQVYWCCKVHSRELWCPWASSGQGVRAVHCKSCSAFCLWLSINRTNNKPPHWPICKRFLIPTQWYLSKTTAD